MQVTRHHPGTGRGPSGLLGVEFVEQAGAEGEKGNNLLVYLSGEGVNFEALEVWLDLQVQKAVS